MALSTGNSGKYVVRAGRHGIRSDLIILFVNIMGKELPDISEEFQKYTALVPEYDFPMSQRAATELRGLVYDEKGEVLPENELVRNVRIFRERIVAKIPQLQDNVYWKKSLHAVKDGRQEVTVGSTEAEFRRAPRTDLKTFQEILSAPQERMALNRDEKFVTARNIVIDPKRITNTLLANLGLDEFIPPKGTRQEEQVALRAQAIPAIKEMLESIEPLTLAHEQELSKLRYFRLFHIGGGKNQGMVLGTQVIADHKVMFLTDLHGAARRIDHIRDGYLQEITTLQQIQAAIREVDGKISTDWQKTKEPEQIDAVKAQLLGLVDTLRFVTNDHKQKMRKQIEQAVSLGSVYTLPEKRKMVKGVSTVVRPAKTVVALNPGATRARINTSHMHIGKRIDEIASIRSYLAKDQTRLDTYLQAQTQPFEAFFKTVKGLHEQFKIYQLDRPMSPQERARAIQNLEALKKKLAFATTPIMLFEPYQSFADELVARIDLTVEALRKDESPETRTEAAAEFTKIFLMTKVQRFYTELQKFYSRYLSNGVLPNADEMLEALAAMDQGLSRKDVAPGIKTEDYNDVFGDLYHLMNSLRLRATKAKDAKAAGLNDDEIRPFITFMRDRVKKFDFVQLLGKIRSSAKPLPPLALD